MDLSKVIVAYYKSTENVLCFNSEIVKNCVCGNRYSVTSSRITRTTVHKYFTNVPENELNSMNQEIRTIERIVYSFCVCNEWYQVNSPSSNIYSLIKSIKQNPSDASSIISQNYLDNYSETPSENDLKIFSYPSGMTVKKPGNRLLTIYGNTSGQHLYDPSNARIASQIIEVYCPSINLNEIASDVDTDRDLSKDKISLCIDDNLNSTSIKLGTEGSHEFCKNLQDPENPGIYFEKGLSLYYRARNSNNTGPEIGYGYKKGGNRIANYPSGEVRPISDSRRCIEGISLKLLLDVYSGSNDGFLNFDLNSLLEMEMELNEIENENKMKNRLNETVLIKRYKNNNWINMFVRKNADNTLYPTFYEQVYDFPTQYFNISNISNFYECCYGLSYDKNAENILYDYFIDKKFTKDTFIKSDVYYSIDDENDYSNLPEVQQYIMSGDLYNDLVFKSNNIVINNIYIASRMNYYDDFKNVKKHKYIIFDFLKSNSIKTIEVSEDIEKAMIYFKTKDISLIRTDFKKHVVRLEHLKHENISESEVVPEGEDDADEYGFRYYRYIINPDNF